MARTPHNAGRSSFKDTVAARSRAIAEAARLRATVHDVNQGGHGPEYDDRDETAPHPTGWMALAVGLLPLAVRTSLREALGPDPSPHAANDDRREHLRQAQSDLRHRESTLDLARAELEGLRRSVDERRQRAEVGEREAEKLLALARRAAAEAATEQRLPLKSVHYDLARSPRRPRAVERLAANIRRFGQLTPVVARMEGGDVHLVTGYRRMAALELAEATHVRVRIVPNLDEATAAALYIAENCLVDGLTSKAVSQLQKSLGEGASPVFLEVIEQVLADDDAVVTEVFLEDMAQEARHHLAEGAAWVAALRPHWAELELTDSRPLVELLTYFARVTAKLQASR